MSQLSQDTTRNIVGSLGASDEDVERMVQQKNLNAPRVTPEALAANIKQVEFTKTVTAGGQVLRWCVITTLSGFAVTGRPSVAVSPENDDTEIGERVAFENAKNELWPLMGYALKERLSEDPFAKLDRIGRVAHEVNRALCQAFGDDSQPAWEDAPQWQRESARMGVDLHLSGDFGPEASHISWANQKLADGWVYGATKDAEAKTHPCLLPFHQLPREQQAKDFLFRAVVHALRT